MLAWAVAASIAPQLGSAILRSPIFPIDILAAHKLEMSDLRNTVCKQHQIRTRSGRGLPGRRREDHAWPRAGLSTILRSSRLEKRWMAESSSGHDARLGFLQSAIGPFVGFGSPFGKRCERIGGSFGRLVEQMPSLVPR